MNSFTRFSRNFTSWPSSYSWRVPFFSGSLIISMRSLFQLPYSTPCGKLPNVLYSRFLILGRESHNKKRTANSAIIIGCKTFTPFVCAIAPTINGKTAPPVPPKAVANPIALTCKCTGSSFVLITIPAGNKGPKKKPRKATATADTTNWGTSQKISSSARAARR